MADFGLSEILLPAALASTEAVAAPALATGLAGAGAGFTAGALGETAGTAAAGIGASSWVPSLATVGTAASVVGTGLQAKAAADDSAYKSDLAKTEAEALRQKSNEDLAIAQRQQITQQRRTDLALSRSRALAAGSGTDATSPDIVNTEGQIVQQGEYNALSALYEGQARSRSDLYQADIDLFRSKAIDRAAPLTIGGTILAGVSNFADRRLRRNYLLDAYGATA